MSRQLSRRDVQPFKVCVRCPAQFPMVIETRPVVESSRGPRVFTTLYWLTCPVLSRRISKFESAGWIGRLEEAARADEKIRESLADLHGAYAFRRLRALGLRLRRRLSKEQPRIAESLRRTGIGGVADPSRIKCLHAHAAYHLVRGGHPLFESPAMEGPVSNATGMSGVRPYPNLLADVTDCRDCERFSNHAV